MTNPTNVVPIETVRTEDGREYRTVVGRIRAFRAGPFGDCGIETEILQTGDRPRCKAMVRDPFGSILATGHAEELVGSSEINQTSALQNAETSAVGRALMFAGLLPVDGDKNFLVLEDGAVYETVESRLRDFRRDYPRYGILTAAVSADAHGYLTQAKICAPDGRVLAMGHDHILRGTNGTGKDLEESETSAVGRALAVLGYASTDTLASAQEVQRAQTLRSTKGAREATRPPRTRQASTPPPQQTDPEPDAASVSSPSEPPAETSASSIPPNLVTVTKRLVGAGFSDVSDLDPEEGKKHPSRFRIEKRDGGYLIQAKTRAHKAALETLGFQCMDAGKGLWVREVKNVV